MIFSEGETCGVMHNSSGIDFAEVLRDFLRAQVLELCIRVSRISVMICLGENFYSLGC